MPLSESFIYTTAPIQDTEPILSTPRGYIEVLVGELSKFHRVLEAGYKMDEHRSVAYIDLAPSSQEELERIVGAAVRAQPFVSRWGGVRLDIMVKTDDDVVTRHNLKSYPFWIRLGLEDLRAAPDQTRLLHGIHFFAGTYGEARKCKKSLLPNGRAQQRTRRPKAKKSANVTPRTSPRARSAAQNSIQPLVTEPIATQASVKAFLN
jgi:hypothetical protein